MNEHMERCDLCGGELKLGTTSLEVWCGDELIIIRDVPADVCQQCQEAYLAAQTSLCLDAFLSEYHRHRPERYLAVPQFSAVQAMGG